MIKYALLGCFVLLFNIDLAYIRSHYETAVMDKDFCKKMLYELNSNKLSNVQLAYLGAFQTIWANHTFNPLTKLSTFKRGRANIDKAIKNDKDNIEIRFIRLSVQKSAPKFLGYYSNIQQDEVYLNKQIYKVKDKNLRDLINKILTK